MEQTTEEQHSRLYIRLFMRIMILVLVILLLKYAMPTLLSLFAPFIAALILAWMLNPLVSLIHKKLHLPRRLVAIVVVVLVFAGLAALMSWVVALVVGEAVSLAKNYQTYWAYVTSTMDYLYVQFSWLMEIFPDIKDFDLMGSLYSWIQNISKDFLDSPYANAATFASAVSNAIVGVLAFVIATYFMTAEYRVLGGLVEKYFGNRIYGYARLLKNSTQSALWRYLRAHFLLAFMAFVVMFTALVIYGQPYAFLIALFLAFIDFLPIVGAITFLVPWSIVEYISGDFMKAIFLLVLAISYFVLRKIVEPKVFGSQMGLHPLVALISIYLGLQWGGILGVILMPILVMVCISVYNTHIFDNSLKDFRDVLRIMGGYIHRKDDDATIVLEEAVVDETVTVRLEDGHMAEDDSWVDDDG